MHSAAARRAERPGKRLAAHLVPQCQGLVQSGSLTGEYYDHLVEYRWAFGNHRTDSLRIPGGWLFKGSSDRGRALYLRGC